MLKKAQLRNLKYLLAFSILIIIIFSFVVLAESTLDDIEVNKLYLDNEQTNSDDSNSDSSKEQTTSAANSDSDNEQLESTTNSNSGITGAVIGASLISGWHLVAIAGILAGIFVALIICQTMLKLKKK